MLADVAKQFAFRDLEASWKNNGADLGWSTRGLPTWDCSDVGKLMLFFLSFFLFFQTHNNVNYNDLKCSRLYIRRQLP